MDHADHSLIPRLAHRASILCLGLGTGLLLAACSKPAQSSSSSGASPSVATAPSAAPSPAQDKASASAAPVQPEAQAGACARMCSTMRALGCPNDPPDCAVHCAEMASIPVCGAEMAAFIACVARQAPSASHCNADGESEIRDGFCDREQAQVAACVERAG